MTLTKKMDRFALLSVVALTATLISTSEPVRTQSPQVQPASSVTYTKDVAPIFNKSCIVCHRSGQMAPMSLVTYENVRPWAQSIKNRVSRRSMPPWHLEPNVGIREYVNDRSLSDAEISTIVRWVDAGAPMGNPADMPAPRQFAADDEWTIGKPDLVVTQLEDYVVPVQAPDQNVSFEVPTGLTEDRYIKAIEARPTVPGRRVVHHSISTAIQPVDAGYTGRADSNPGAPNDSGVYLIEFVPGTSANVHPENTGKLLKAGSKIRISTHYHSIGEEVRDRMTIAMTFYPKGYVPKYQILTMRVRPQPGEDGNYLDIPPGAVNVRHDGFFRLEKPAMIVSFQPHMHYRGQGMTLEAVLPDARTQLLTSVDRYDFSWQITYTYKNPPVFPAGTVLHSVAYHNNSKTNKYNPDPLAWVGFGQRTIDEMANGWTDFVYIDEAEYQRILAERNSSNNN